MGRRKIQRGGGERSHLAREASRTDLFPTRAESDTGALVSEPSLKLGRAVRLGTNGWLLLAVVCLAAAAGFVWMISRRHNDSAGQVPREPEAQESQPVPTPDGPSPVARLRDVQPVPHVKQEEALSTQPAPPPPDRQAVVEAEIDAHEKESIEIVQTLIQDFPNKSDPLGLMGMVYNRCDQTAKALEYWERALDRNPNRPDLYDAMAAVALRKEEYEKAEELCRKGLGKSAQMPQLHYHLAEALNGLGRAEESVDELQIGIKLSPETADFHCLLGTTYALLNEYGKAKISYETAIKLQPRNAPAQYGLAVACAKLAVQEQSKRAMEEYQKLNAENMQAQRSRRGIADDAVKYRKILAMTCSDVGTVYIANGRPGKAEPLLRRGAEVDPENKGCRIQLAQILCIANRLAETVPVIRQLIEIEPGNAIFYLRLAMVYARIEQLDEARKAAKKATELAPDSEECRRFLEQLQAKR